MPVMVEWAPLPVEGGQEFAGAVAVEVEPLAADLGVSTQRRHSTLGCLTPVAHEEQRLLLLQDPAA